MSLYYNNNGEGNQFNFMIQNDTVVADETIPSGDAGPDDEAGRDLSPRPTCSGTGRISKDFRLRDYTDLMER